MERVLADVREVSGSDKSLAEIISVGEVPKPDVMDFNTWQVWRRDIGLRPQTTRKDPATTTPKQEAELWRATMQTLYGADWRIRLEEAQLAAAEAEDQPPASAASASGGPAAAVPAAAGVATEAAQPAAAVSAAARVLQGASGGADSPRELRKALLSEFNAAEESAEGYRQRMTLVGEQLESLGAPMTQEEQSKVNLRVTYGIRIKDMDKETQSTTLKKEFERVLS